MKLAGGRIGEVGKTTPGHPFPPYSSFLAGPTLYSVIHLIPQSPGLVGAGGGGAQAPAQPQLHRVDSNWSLPVI